MDQPGNPNPSYDYSSLAKNTDTLEFELSDYLLLGDVMWEDLRMEETVVLSPSEKTEGVNPDRVGYHSTERETINDISYGPKRRRLVESGSRVAFRTKSELEVMDDGYKWRKYGKKSIKNSPHPRNYYRCSSEGCRVKKKVERDREDPSHVITTYEGVHHHDSPSSFAYSSDDIGSLLYHHSTADQLLPTSAI